MSTHLTPAQRALLLAELEQHRQRLDRQLSEHLHGQSRAERAHDVLEQDNDDAPQRLPEREVAAALSDQERRELEAVTASLARMARGDYGVCADCGVDIPFDRLKVEPSALRCVDCESRHERGSPRAPG